MDDIRRILKKATDSLGRVHKKHRTSNSDVEKTARIINKIGKDVELLINELETPVHDAVQNSINLLKIQIEQRKSDIEDAEEWKDCASNILNEAEEDDRHAETIYRSGRRQMNHYISCWKVRNEKAEAEIRRLEWQLKN